MPGKVNPVIPEVVNQIAFEVIGNDVTVTMAAEAGQLQLNAFEPIIAHSLFKSVTHLRHGCLTLAERCVDGITANRERLRRARRRTRSASSPRSTRTSATRTRPRSRRKRTPPAAASTSSCCERGLLTQAQLDDLLRPEALTTPAAARLDRPLIRPRRRPPRRSPVPCQGPHAKGLGTPEPAE